MNLKFPLRKLLALSALLAFFFAAWGGLLRLQWHFPVARADWISFHGPLMVNGFFGTIITLGRASALKSRIGLAVPFAAALGAWTLLLGGPEGWGAAFFLLASLGYCGLCLDSSKSPFDPYAAFALMGSGGWAWANFMWLEGRPIPQIMAGWQVFFILTISSERLKVIGWRATGHHRLPPFLGAGLMLAGALWQPFNPTGGLRTVSMGCLVMAFYLLALDATQPSEKMWGWGVFSKACRYSRYGWLLVCAMLGLLVPPIDSGFIYDAFLHSFFLGFVFFMVFNHAPLLLPRILKTPVPFQHVFYLHWSLLHVSLLIRIGGDLLGFTGWRRWGGLLNTLTLLLFALNTLWAVRKGRRLAVPFPDEPLRSASTLPQRPSDQTNR